MSPIKFSTPWIGMEWGEQARTCFLDAGAQSDGIGHFTG